MDRGTTATATTVAVVRHWLADHRRRASRRARDRPSPVRQTARDRARVSRRELLRWKTYGGGGSRRRNPTTRSAPDVACRLLAGRADDRAIGAGRAIRDRIGVPRALGLAAGLGLEAWQTRRSVRSRMDSDRLPSRLQSVVLNGRAPGGANAVFAVGGLGSRGGCGAGPASPTASVRRCGAARSRRWYSVSVANARLARRSSRHQEHPGGFA